MTLENHLFSLNTIIMIYYLVNIKVEQKAQMQTKCGRIPYAPYF